MRNAVVLLICVGLITACSGPMGPIAGGQLEGTPTPWPDDWSFTDDIENILLQTNPADPYSVTIWLVTTHDGAFIAASDTDAQWVENIFADPNVILSINGQLIDARATQTTSAEELTVIAQAYQSKYDMEQDDFVESDGIVFRLSNP